MCRRAAKAFARPATAGRAIAAGFDEPARLGGLVPNQQSKLPGAGALPEVAVAGEPRQAGPPAPLEVMLARMLAPRAAHAPVRVRAAGLYGDEQPTPLLNSR